MIVVAAITLKIDVSVTESDSDNQRKLNEGTEDDAGILVTRQVMKSPWKIVVTTDEAMILLSSSKLANCHKLLYSFKQ